MEGNQGLRERWCALHGIRAKVEARGDGASAYAGLSPKMALPTRTMVAPSSTATS